MMWNMAQSLSIAPLSSLFSLHYGMAETPTRSVKIGRENRIRDQASAAVMSDDSYEADYEAHSLSASTLLSQPLTSYLHSPHAYFSLSHLLLLVFFPPLFLYFSSLFSFELWECDSHLLSPHQIMASLAQSENIL